MGNVLVLWDLDFTLLYAGGVAADVYREVCLDLFGRRLAALPPMAGRTERAIILDALARMEIDEPRRHVDAFVAALTSRAPDMLPLFATRGHAMPGAAAALAALAAHAPQMPAGQTSSLAPSAAGSPVAAVQSVLTGNIRAVAEAKLAAFGLAGHLDLAVGAYGEHHEVRAELVHLARRQAALAYGQDFDDDATVLIGDTPLDVAAALASGARVIGVATGGSSLADLLAAGAHAALPDLTDTAALLAAILGPRTAESPAASPVSR